jgi:putative ATPase
MTPQANTPLAERMRPNTINDVMGQEHVIGDQQFLRSVIEQGRPVSMILWGPPGTGKTTLARIIARASNYEFEEISAVTSGLPDVKKVIERAKIAKNEGKNSLLFVDEIHRFNKAQQDAFLPHVENGTIVMIGATTENPSFEVIGPLLSRSRVVVLEPLSKDSIVAILKRAVKHLGTTKVEPKAIDLLAEMSGGDARMALTGLEAAAAIEQKTISAETIKQAMQQKTARYDKGGEYHFNLISAYIKSMRGGDVDAALYYMARMLAGGEDPKFIARRLVVFASEDVGLASPGALTLAVSAFQAVERIGMPECQIILSQATITMARSKKSRSSYDAIMTANQAAKDFPDAQVPLHLRNAPTKLMKNLGYGKGAKWEAGFEHPDGFIPKELEGRSIYPGEE